MEDEGMVITVNGPIVPNEVGIALTHEHVFVDLRKYYRPSPDADTARELDGPVQMSMLGHLRLMDHQNLDNLVLDNYDVATKELARFRKRGGKTICDVSSRGIRIDDLLPSLRRISRSLGLNIVVGTGCYIASYHEPFVGKAEGADLATLFAQEITLGIGSSGIRAGMIGEIGLSAPPVDVELRVLKAAGWAHLETGAPIIIHQSERKEYSIAHRGLDVLEHEGVSPERVVIAHAGLAEDLNGLEALVRRGAYVAFDHFGMSKYAGPRRSLDMPDPAASRTAAGVHALTGWSRARVAARTRDLRGRFDAVGPIIREPGAPLHRRQVEDLAGP